MPLFRRRRDDALGPENTSAAATTESPAGSVAPGDAADPVVAAADPAPTGAATPPAPGPAGAPSGPVDVSVLTAEDREGRLDLGSLLLPAAGDSLEGLEVQLQADEATGDVIAVLVLEGTEAAVELRAFAAPKRATLWDEVRAEIADGARNAGGQTAEALGAWGIELLVQVPVVLPDGQQALQVSRIAGVDGPRWFLRATFLGRAAVEPGTAGRLQALVEGVAVVRGDGPMAPRDPIPLVVPGQPAPGDVPPAEVLAPFERGPEITETR